MNKHMQRYIDDEAEDDVATTRENRSSKPAKSPVKQDRRQKDKAWGRAIGKFHKEREKFQQQHGRKPE